MWYQRKAGRMCRDLEVRLEEFLEQLEEDPSARPAPQVAAHLAACESCRTALEETRQVGALLRSGRDPVSESLASDPFFAARVGARLRERVRTGAEFWPQLEAVSLRLMAAGLSIAVILGALAAWGVPNASRTATARLRPADVRVISPELNPAPANPDDVVVALWSTERGRQQR
jgi:hypothetical protein